MFLPGQQRRPAPPERGFAMLRNHNPPVRWWHNRGTKEGQHWHVTGLRPFRHEHRGDEGLRPGGHA